MDSSTSPNYDLVQFADLQVEMLELLFGPKWFVKAKGRRLHHPSYTGWLLCKRIRERGAIASREEILELGKLALDTMPLFALIGGNLRVPQVGDWNLIAGPDFLKNLRREINDAGKYDDRMVELYVAGRYREQGLQVEFLKVKENKRTPDLMVRLKVPNIPLFIECKRLRSVSSLSLNHLQDSINDANKQLRQARQDITPPGIDPVPYGAAILDITSAVVSDLSKPEMVIQEVAKVIGCIHQILSKGDYTSVHYVLVVWSEYNLIMMDEGKVGLGVHRVSYSVKHPTTIPPFPPAADGQPMGPMFEVLIEDELFPGYGYILTAHLLPSEEE